MTAARWEVVDDDRLDEQVLLSSRFELSKRKQGVRKHLVSRQTVCPCQILSSQVRDRALRQRQCQFRLA
jgi:hypothetical protein